MARRTVRFLFDYISPYAYLAWTQVGPVLARQDADLELVPILFAALLDALGTTQGNSILVFLILLACCGLYFVGLYFYRKSIRFRVTSTNIETERGILSKKIDILELWRCRDVRYKQNLLDRILGIAHIEIFTADVTSPHIEITGLPASRQLFEQIRDSIELQRQARNVYGVVS